VVGFRFDENGAAAAPSREASMDVDDRVISFGEFRLDRASGRLLEGATEVRLRSKTFAVLEYLVLRRGELVRKEEILGAVWPDTHVTPSVLTGCIRELRSALGDDARAARFVETVHRRGYRFVAASETDAGASAAGRAVRRTTTRAWLPARDSEIAELARLFARAVARIARRRSRRAPRAGRGGRGRPRRPRYAR
jgi:DNA-binding winged helix-turn-helix (wHTH) protein